MANTQTNTQAGATAKREAEGLAQDVRAEAETITDEARHAAQDASRAAADTASELAQAARARAYEYGTQTKDHAANETTKVASALRGAAQDLDDGSVQEQLVGRMASGVADAADALRTMPVEQIGDEFTGFARRNPLAFLGGAALVGFAAARFLKASAEDEEAYYDDTYPATGPYGSTGPGHLPASAHGPQPVATTPQTAAPGAGAGEVGGGPTQTPAGTNPASANNGGTKA